MGNIVLLDELTINKIAAGEVIERPASVVKEMVENSIDAGATNITVEIRNGGISYIRVIDNGKGISADDLEMAFERHATSKIRVADDLQQVTSMGFRGEALASIAAVANVELVSKTEGQNIGYKVVVEGGNVLNKEEAGCSTGTIITVQNLFFNTPVRYKFLKKDYTESGYIEDIVTQMALIHPEIAFKLINSGKTIIQTTGNGDLSSVVYSIYGKDIADNIINTEYKYEDIIVKGVIGKPAIARSNRSNQMFFVNKRCIKDKTLSAAVTEAFKGMIPIGKFGFVILDLEIDPSKVDVNVHPAKLEVRFEEENKIFKAIYHTIKDALLKSELVANTAKEPETKDIAAEIEEEPTIEEHKEDRAGGLFGWRKNKKEDIDKEIEEIGDRDNIISQIYNNKQNDDEIPKAFQRKEQPAGEPIDTFEILEQLKGLQEKLKNDKEEIENEIKNENVDDLIETPETENEEEPKNTEGLAEDATTEYELNTEEDTEENIEETQAKIEERLEKDDALKEEFTEVKTKIDQMLDGATGEIPSDFTEMYLKTFGIMPKTETNQEETDQEEITNGLDAISYDNTVSLFEDTEEDKKPIYKIIGIAFKTYIILEIKNELFLIDQHAAHERILYEKVKNNYYNNEPKNSQLLLLPDVITLTHKEMDIAKDNMEMFKKAGFELEEFGENTIKLSGVPDICVDLDTKELFLETLDEINSVARTAKQEVEERFMATVACKAAVKAGMTLSEEEVKGLMDKLLVLPNPFTCPHGRPTAIKMTEYDIERKFARK